MRRRVTSESDEVEALIRARTALVDGLVAVAEGSRDAEALDALVRAYAGVAAPGPEGDTVATYVEALEALVHAVRWTDAAWRADEGAERHATAARLRATQLLARADDRWPEGLKDALTDLESLSGYDIPPRAAAVLSRIPIPVRLTDAFRGSGAVRPFVERDARDDVAPAIALMIRLHGEPVMRPAILQPGALHQFEVEARVTKWPEAADQLEITFMSVFPRDILYVSDLRFSADALTQPLEIRVAGARPPGDPPLGLTARAWFLGESGPSDARITGNTTLEIVTFDAGTARPVNMPSAALRLQQMMGELSNALPHLSVDDRKDARLLLEGLLTFAHTVLDDRLGQQDDVDEAWFQAQVRSFLQANPEIGARLVERVGRAGGATDLVLGNIVLELKLERASPISVITASSRYAAQPTQYASAGDSQVSLLAVLDVSAKRAPAGVMGNEMAWAYPEVASGPNPPLPSLVGVVVIRGGFPRPSDFSH
jgi:hypothetical protein